MISYLKPRGLLVCLVLGAALVAQPGCATHKEAFRTKHEYKTDKKLASKVTDALQNAPVYKYPDVQVNVYQGQVQLSGFVATAAQRDMASRLAGQVPGVTHVENDLLLKRMPGPAVGGAEGP